MPRSFVATLLAGLTALGACRHRTWPVMFTGCALLRPIGPPGHIHLIRSATHDSVSPDPRIGRLVAIVHWSSDSLGREAQPPGAFVHMTDTETHFDTSQFVRTSGVLAVLLSVPQVSYRFGVRFIGAH